MRAEGALRDASEARSDSSDSSDSEDEALAGAKRTLQGARFRCGYATGLGEGKDDIEDLAAPVASAERLLAHAAETSQCSYFAQRRLLRERSVLLMPYASFFLDAGARNEHDVVVVDEAHNLPQTLRDLFSFSYAFRTIQDALRAVHDNWLAALLRAQTGLAEPVVPASVAALLDDAYVAQTGLARADWEAVARVLLADSLAALTALSREPRRAGAFAQTPTRAVPAARLALECLAREPAPCAAKQRSTKDAFADLIKDMRENPREGEPLVPLLVGPSAPERIERAWRRQARVLRALFRRLRDVAARPHGFSWTVALDDARTVQFECLDASLGFERHFAGGQTVLMSGTLEPADALARELLGPAAETSHAHCATDHVILPDQLRVYVDASRRGVAAALATAEQRAAYYSHAGRVVRKFTSSVRGGVVVFFTSKAKVRQALDTWRAERTLDSIVRGRLLVEDTGDRPLAPDAWPKYLAAARAPRGALLLTYIGGTFSEGKDTRDDAARCVIVVGVPEPPPDKSRQMAAHLGAPNWSAQQAMRQVNQCVGRLIRHARDYGVAVLCDQRYRDPRYARLLSQWIRERALLDEGAAEAPEIAEWQAGLERRLADRPQ